MTANQIAIPLAFIFLALFIAVIVVRSRRAAKTNAQRHHRPNAPANGQDKGAIARSAMEGHGSGGQF